MTNKQISSIVVPEGWHVVEQPSFYRLLAVSEGQERTGKSDFALQLPKPLAYIPLDRRRVPGRDSERMFPPGVIEPVNPAFPDAAPFRFDPRKKPEEQIEEIWPRVEEAIFSAIEERSFRSLVIDTGSQLWELIRLFKLGKLAQVMPEKYMEPNMLFRSLIEAIEDRADLNCIICHKVKKEYSDRSGSGRGNWTGNYERTGFNDIGFMVNHTLKHGRTEDEDGQTKFTLEIIDSTNPSAIGEKYDEAEDDAPIRLENVARLLLPGSKKTDWR